MPRILIIDDDNGAQKVFSAVLKKRIPNVQIISAQSGEDGLAKAKEVFPDTILLDICMQGIDGFSVCRQLKSDAAIKRIPVVMTTGMSIGSEMKIKALDSGADAFLSKPPDSAELVAQVNSMLRIKKNEDQLLKDKELLEDLLEEKAKSLRKSEIKNRTILESINEGYYEVNVEGDFTFFNDSVCTIFGTNRESLKKTNYSHYIHPDDIENVYHVYRRVFFKREPERKLDCKIIKGDGTIGYIDISISLIFTSDGKVTGFRGIARDVTERKQAKDALMESENYLRTIMDTIQTGLIINDNETQNILDVNPYALKMIGCKKTDLIGSKWNEYILPSDKTPDHFEPSGATNLGEDGFLRTNGDTPLQVRLSKASAKINGRKFCVQSFLDITDIKQLLEKQAVNINLATEILNLINGHPPRHIDFYEGVNLFIDSFSAPCNAAGGDHYFVKSISDCKDGLGKTLISLKDQSGHEVNCILKSIITDLFHNAILHSSESANLEKSTSQLNDQICGSQLFKEDDFLTGITVEIDNQSLKMKYVSYGHPPFLLIRDRDVKWFPEKNGSGRNLPLAVFKGIEYTAEDIQLKEGDKLVFYTDGLTDMPFDTLDSRISLDELVAITKEFINRDKIPNVSEIVKHLVDYISDISGNEIIPYQKNTSADDITLFGIEIENHCSYEEEILSVSHRYDLRDCIAPLVKKISDAWSANGFNVERNAIRCALEESVINAWVHGNCMDGNKEIHVRWWSANDCHLEVRDQGKGFDSSQIKDPTAPHSRLKESGRGIYMIRRLADEVRWKNGGSRIVSSFRKDRFSVTDSQSGQRMPLWEKCNLPRLTTLSKSLQQNQILKIA